MSNIQNTEMEKRGKYAAACLLFSKGFDIVAQDWKCASGTADIIARDSHSIVFVEVMTCSDEIDGFPKPNRSDAHREKWEEIAIAFLAGYDEVNITVRFDQVAVKVLTPNRAMIRHFIGAYSIA